MVKFVESWAAHRKMVWPMRPAAPHMMIEVVMVIGFLYRVKVSRSRNPR
jgi:hypothetical protein